MTPRTLFHGGAAPCGPGGAATPRAKPWAEPWAVPWAEPWAFVEARLARVTPHELNAPKDRKRGSHSHSAASRAVLGQQLIAAAKPLHCALTAPGLLCAALTAARRGGAGAGITVYPTSAAIRQAPWRPLGQRRAVDASVPQGRICFQLADEKGVSPTLLRGRYLVIRPGRL